MAIHVTRHPLAADDLHFPGCPECGCPVHGTDYDNRRAYHVTAAGADRAVQKMLSPAEAAELGALAVPAGPLVLTPDPHDPVAMVLAPCGHTLTGKVARGFRTEALHLTWYELVIDVSVILPKWLRGYTGNPVKIGTRTVHPRELTGARPGPGVARLVTAAVDLVATAAGRTDDPDLYDVVYPAGLPAPTDLVIDVTVTLPALLLPDAPFRSLHARGTYRPDQVGTDPVATVPRLIRRVGVYVAHPIEAQG